MLSLRTVKSLIFGFLQYAIIHRKCCQPLVVIKSGSVRPQKVVKDAAKALERKKIKKHKKYIVNLPKKCFINFGNTFFVTSFMQKMVIFGRIFFCILPLDRYRVNIFFLSFTWTLGLTFTFCAKL